MHHRHLEKVVVPVENGLVVLTELKFGEPRTFKYSMTFARILAPRAVIKKQYEEHCSEGRNLESCCICLNDDYVHYMLPLPCGHHFHRKCIRKWFCSRLYRSSTSCPICRQSMVYSCGHAINIDEIAADELWHPDELQYNCSQAPIRYARAVALVENERKERAGTSKMMTTTTTATEMHGIWASDMLGKLPLGWIIAWALDGTKVVEMTEESPVIMLDSAHWHEHLVLQLGFLRKLARSDTADCKLERFWSSFLDLDEALAALRRCEAEKSSETSRLRAWEAHVRWRGAFDRAQHDLEHFLSLDEVLHAGRKVYSTIDENSLTAVFLPWLWRYRRRRLGLTYDHLPQGRSFFGVWPDYIRTWVDRWAIV